MLFKGLVELELCGEKRGFKFGMASLTRFCQLENISWFQIDARIKDGDPSTIINFFLAGHEAYCKKNKLEFTATFDDVCEWIDELGLVEAVEEMGKVFQNFDPKNSSAPTVTSGANQQVENGQ